MSGRLNFGSEEEEDFGPSAKLGALFGAGDGGGEGGLAYVPPKAPSDKAPGPVKEESKTLLAAPVQALLLREATWAAAGKLGLALLWSRASGASLLLYQASKKPVATVPLPDAQLKALASSDAGLSLKDSAERQWALHFGSSEERRRFCLWAFALSPQSSQVFLEGGGRAATAAEEVVVEWEEWAFHSQPEPSLTPALEAKEPLRGALATAQWPHGLQTRLTGLKTGSELFLAVKATRRPDTILATEETAILWARLKELPNTAVRKEAEQDEVLESQSEPEAQVVSEPSTAEPSQREKPADLEPEAEPPTASEADKEETVKGSELRSRMAKIGTPALPMPGSDGLLRSRSNSAVKEDHHAAPAPPAYPPKPDLKTKPTSLDTVTPAEDEKPAASCHPPTQPPMPQPGIPGGFPGFPGCPFPFPPQPFPGQSELPGASFPYPMPYFYPPPPQAASTSALTVEALRSELDSALGRALGSRKSDEAAVKDKVKEILSDFYRDFAASLDEERSYTAEEVDSMVLRAVKAQVKKAL